MARKVLLFFALIIEDLDDLLDPAVRSEVVTADSHANWVMLEGRRQLPHRVWPSCADYTDGFRMSNISQERES